VIPGPAFNQGEGLSTTNEHGVLVGGNPKIQPWDRQRQILSFGGSRQNMYSVASVGIFVTKSEEDEE
jgi:hypothetical protein